MAEENARKDTSRLLSETDCNMQLDDMGSSSDSIASIEEPMTILVVGESGVGKSTFINSLINYVTFVKFSEAEESSELIGPVTSSFTVTEADGRETKVVTGYSVDEVQVNGESSTRKTKMYNFQKGQYNLKLIDTPGIGDVGGVMKDHEHLDDMIQCIRQLDSLHAIIILMRSNESHLSARFRYCMQEIMSRLHASAIENIVFGFTRSRSSSYDAGDSLSILQQLLETTSRHKIQTTTENMYCFESESYRFLAAKKMGVIMDDEVRATCMKSWKHSCDEVMRLLTHISNLVPHNVKETSSLDDMFNLQRLVITPLVLTAKRLQLDRQILQIEEQKWMSMKRLTKRLSRMQVSGLHDHDLGWRVVCLESECVKLQTKETMKDIVYPTLCHHECTEFVNVSGSDVDLKDCFIMNAIGLCLSCNHDCNNHILLPFDQSGLGHEFSFSREFLLDQLDERAVSSIVKKRQKKVNELDQEKKFLEKTAAELGFYMQQNAVLQKSDNMLQSLSRLIEEEEKKAVQSKDLSVVRGLRHMRDYYQIQIDQMDRMVKKEAHPAAIDCDERLQKLLSLKHAGRLIRKEMSEKKL